MTSYYADPLAPGAYPQPIALAASWDPALLREVNAAIAKDLGARGVRLALAPSLEVTRDPRRGRIERTFGEDPYLVGEMGVAAIEGLQGTGRTAAIAPGKVQAAMGSFAGHDLPREDSEVGPAPVSERELREVFFRPFEEAIRRTGIGALVASRNEIDSVPVHANKWLLRDILRGEWHFGGTVYAAPGGVAELASTYHVAATPAEAARLAHDAGIDADLSDSATFAPLAQAATSGNMNAARGTTLSLKAAQRSITLLKNDGTLPLARPAAARGTLAVIELGTTPIGEALKARARARTEVLVPGANASLLDVARQAQRTVVVIGEAGVAEQHALMGALKALGKPIVVILAGDRPAADAIVAEQASALLAAWGLGEQGGRAVADVLFGDVNPGGKLPITIARNAGQLPLFYDAKPSARRGYLFDTSAPLFAFGWGLSYSTFEVGAPRLSEAFIAPDGSVRVSVDLRNTSRIAGDETVQLYIRDKVGSVARPVKQLRGFQRVSLAPGARRTVEFTLGPRSLEMWDDRMRRVVEPGEFEVMAGANSTQVKSVTLTVTGGRP